MNSGAIKKLLEENQPKSETRERKEYVDRWNTKLVYPSFTTEEYEKERSKHEITDVPRKHL